VGRAAGAIALLNLIEAGAARQLALALHDRKFDRRN
jgi:hypothetical protein